MDLAPAVAVSSRLLTQAHVAAVVGCSTRGACAIIRAIEDYHVGMYAEKLRTSEDALARFLRTVSRHKPRTLKRGVYFVADSGDAVKIGVTNKIARRLHGLQSGNPRQLEVLAMFPGSEAVEAYYHGRFREHHIHGEWFRREGTLDAFLRSHGK